MAHTNYFPAGEVTDHLLTLEQAQERLATTEPIAQSSVHVSESVNFRVLDGWNENLSGDEQEQIPVFMTANGREMQLTQESLLDLTSLMGMGRGKFVPKQPAHLLEGQLNHWYKGGLGEMEVKVLEVNGIARSVVRGGLQPFSNLQVLDQALAAIRSKYGNDAEVFVDKKMTHGLDKTYMRLVIPEQTRVIQNTGTDNDTWSIGLAWQNSLKGIGNTSMEGYLFRYWCKNGSYDVNNEHGGNFSRRGARGQDGSIYEWARSEVDGILGGLESALDHVQSLTEISVMGEANNVLEGIWTDYGISDVNLRADITEGLLNNPGNMTMYDVMQAITSAANSDDISAAQQDRLMRLGGQVSGANAVRCDRGSLHLH